MTKKLETSIIVAHFTMEKATKNTFRFQERGDPEQHKIGTLYVQKSAFKDGKAPETLTATIS